MLEVWIFTNPKLHGFMANNIKTGVIQSFGSLAKFGRNLQKNTVTDIPSQQFLYQDTNFDCVCGKPNSPGCLPIKARCFTAALTYKTLAQVGSIQTAKGDSLRNRPQLGLSGY